ncbi:MAG: transposase [Eubacteriales bacterium]
MKNYDYSTTGYYYVTICTQDRQELFGKISVGADSISAPSFDPASIHVELNNIGFLFDKILSETIQSFSGITLDNYIIMPDHIHMIIAIDNEIATTQNEMESGADMESAPAETKVGLPQIIQAFKRYTTISYIEGVKHGVFPPFHQRIWQKNYYKHIIRGKEDHQQICEYIYKNPIKKYYENIKKLQD